MKYKVGDKVKIKSKEWYEENKDEDGIVVLGDISFIEIMSAYCGMDAIIETRFGTWYELNIDTRGWNWTDEMLEDENEEHGQITLQAPDNSQAILDQISILTHTLDVLCTTGRAKSANIVEEKIMGLIQGL